MKTRNKKRTHTKHMGGGKPKPHVRATPSSVFLSFFCYQKKIYLHDRIIREISAHGTQSIIVATLCGHHRYDKNSCRALDPIVADLRFFRDEAVLKTLHTTAGGMYWIVSSERHRQGGAPIRGNIIRADEMGARTPISNAYSLS